MPASFAHQLPSSPHSLLHSPLHSPPHTLTPPLDTRFLPLSREEAELRGWPELDVVMVTGDAYVDHPAFGPILIARLLAARGLRVAILAQPDWRSVTDFRRFGRPRLFFGISAGNVDSMLNRLTAHKQSREGDPYSPGGRPGQRPDRATLVYANRCREAFPEVPIILGGTEASLRRLAHYDYWSDTVRKPILVDAKADLLVFGDGERPILEVTERLLRGEPMSSIRDVRGTALLLPADEVATRLAGPAPTPIELPSFEEVAGPDEAARLRFAEMSRLHHHESSPQDGRPLLQRAAGRAVYFNPPSLPLQESELATLYDLPFARLPHPSYREPVPAYETVQHALRLGRGCSASVLRELSELRQLDDFTGPVSTLGGPTTNLYGMYCDDAQAAARCRRRSCVSPDICPHLHTAHRPLLIAGHPGATLAMVIELALYLKQRALQPLEVQDFVPTPMSLATAMYHTGRDPLSPDASRLVYSARRLRDKKLQRALLMHWDHSQHELVREALLLAGRRDLIGHGPGCLVPPAARRSARPAAPAPPT
jgi:radical SAM superfamily enzyme YgiQ (UPF0313 family)